EFRHVVAQLDDALEAVVAEKLGWIIGATEEAAAIAALLGDQERRERVLAVDRAERRDRAVDRLRAAQRCLDLLEIDAAGEARRRRRVDGGRRQVGVCGAAEPLDALAEGEVDLVDAAEAVSPVAVSFEAEAAQAILLERRQDAGVA